MSSFLKILFLGVSLLPSMLSGQSISPVTPGASPEARALFTMIQSLSGKYTLTGQHNFPISGAKNTSFAADYIGMTPVVWSQDFGFSEDGDKDSYLARPDIIREAIKQHKNGAIVTLCWHAVPPTATEPVTFQSLPNADSMALASVQGKLPDQQFADILTPGTELHKYWLAQVDEIARWLKVLEEAKVPVLWRPYHEMNGNWFWWGGRYQGEYTTKRLYQQIFDRMVNYHKLNNLIWMWSVDRPTEAGREFTNYYPGEGYLDIVSLDVYGSDFQQSYYDELKALSKGKPLALGEVGVPPTLEVLKDQPNWTFYVIWSGMTRLTPLEQYQSYMENTRMLFLEDSVYADFIQPLRNIAQLSSLHLKSPVDMSGQWELLPGESEISSGFGGGAAHTLNIIQVQDVLAVESISTVEWGDDEKRKILIYCDGSEHEIKSEFGKRYQKAYWSKKKDNLNINNRSVFTFGGNTREFTGKEIWSLSAIGNKLIIHQMAETFRGDTKSKMVYRKVER